MIFWQTIVFW